MASGPGEENDNPRQYSWGFLVQRIKSLPAKRETQVRVSLGREDPLEKGMATHSGILACKMPWTEEPGGLQFCGVAESWTQLSD